MNISLDYKLFIDMAKKENNKFSTWKKKKPLERKVADDLVRQSEKNEKLREKTMRSLDFFDLF